MNDENHDNLESLVRAVVSGYSEQPSFLPNKDAVIDILEMVRRVLFPGYFENEATELTDLYFYVGSLMMDLGNRLSKADLPRPDARHVDVGRLHAGRRGPVRRALLRLSEQNSAGCATY